MFLSSVFLIQLFLINIIRFFYGLYLFKYKKEILNKTRNFGDFILIQNSLNSIKEFIENEG
jgi:hypothetical protein